MLFLVKMKRTAKLAIVILLLAFVLGTQFISLSGSVAHAGGGGNCEGHPNDCLCDDLNWKWNWKLD